MRSLLPWLFNWKQVLPFGRNRSLETGEVHDTWRLRDGTAVTLRPARYTDGPLIQDMVRGLSLQSRYRRFFYPVHELTPDMLERFTQSDPLAAMTLLAVIQENRKEVVVAMAQYVAEGYPEHCDFAIVVADDWQRRSIAKRMIQALVCIARAVGIRHIQGDVLTENEPMRRLMLGMGFALMQHKDGAYLRKASKVLEAPEWKCSPLTALAKQPGVTPAHA